MGFFNAHFFVFLKGIGGISVYIFQHMRKGGEIMNIFREKISRQNADDDNGNGGVDPEQLHI